MMMLPVTICQQKHHHKIHSEAEGEEQMEKPLSQFSIKEDNII